MLQGRCGCTPITLGPQSVTPRGAPDDHHLPMYKSHVHMVHPRAQESWMINFPERELVVSRTQAACRSPPRLEYSDQPTEWRADRKSHTQVRRQRHERRDEKKNQILHCKGSKNKVNQSKDIIEEKPKRRVIIWQKGILIRRGRKRIGHELQRNSLPLRPWARR